jgi:DNA-binding CsgD family transcriptional regulator
MKNREIEIINRFSTLYFLNERQKQILLYLCDGYSQNKICTSLNISRGTVIKYVSDLKYIFKANNLAQLGYKAEKSIFNEDNLD